MVHFLWLTLCDPNPRTNGQFIYSGGLISAVAKAGAQLTVLGLAREPSDREAHAEDGIEWCLAADESVHALRRLASRFPSSALRTSVGEMRSLLKQQLRNAAWDALVIDSINVAWAVPHLVRYRRKQPAATIAYLAQNNETEVALEAVRVETGWRRAIRLLQAAKTARLERRLAGAADVVTADAPEDCEYLSRLSGGRAVFFVPPGYDRPRVGNRSIGAETPRRAIIVGSFDWPLKRASLEAFLTDAAPLFHAHDIELHVVGRTAPSYVQGLHARFPTVKFFGSVPQTSCHLAGARIGLVPDVLGSFKLKSLEYVFNRLPIFGIEGAVPGLGLENGAGIILAKTHRELASAVIHAIDDLDLLNRLQETAFVRCESRFDWDVIGDQLLRTITLGREPGGGLAEYSARSVSTWRRSPLVRPARRGAMGS